MSEQTLIRAQYHRLESQYNELQLRLTEIEADLSLAQTNLADALRALEAIADGSSNATGIARATHDAIEERMAAHHHR